MRISFSWEGTEKELNEHWNRRGKSSVTHTSIQQDFVTKSGGRDKEKSIFKSTITESFFLDSFDNHYIRIRTGNNFFVSSFDKNMIAAIVVVILYLWADCYHF